MLRQGLRGWCPRGFRKTVLAGAGAADARALPADGGRLHGLGRGGLRHDDVSLWPQEIHKMTLKWQSSWLVSRQQRFLFPVRVNSVVGKAKYRVTIQPGTLV